MNHGNKAHKFIREELIKILEANLNKTLGEADVNHVFDKAKSYPKITGIAGDVVEQSILGYSADNRQEPDLLVDGIRIELKTTGIRISKKEKNKYEAKEPMSITAVSPDTIVIEIFENSNFWHKLEHLLFVYYLYDSPTSVNALEYANFPIKGYEFFEFKEEDREILKNDWTTVRNFIISLQSNYENFQAEYPRISSELRDKLLFIDTAPKWPHPPRFRLKRSVVTNIVQEHFGQSLEQLPGKYTSYTDIDKKCHNLAEKYAGKTVEILAGILHIHDNLSNKAISERLIVRMFDGESKKISKIELFSKIGMFAKSIVLTKEGLRTEDMKLFCIDFDEITNKGIDFEDSTFYSYFADCQMLCIVFEEPSVKAEFKENIFIGFKRFSFNQTFIDNEVRPIWNKIRELIFSETLVDLTVIDNKTGKPRINKKTKTIQSAPNFPKSADGIVFVRGSSSDSTFKPEVVNGIRMYRQYLWIKGSYISDCLRDKNFL